jgi:hypothetical protein
VTKKHYEAIAAAIRSHAVQGTPDWRDCAEKIAYALAAVFARDNPKFDRARFLKACGLS